MVGNLRPCRGGLCHRALGVREFPLSDAVAVCGPTWSVGAFRAPHVRGAGRGARGRRTYAWTCVKIQGWFLISVLVAESDDVMDLSAIRERSSSVTRWHMMRAAVAALRRRLRSCAMRRRLYKLPCRYASLLRS